VIIGTAATSTAWVAWVASGATFASLDWRLYDRWLAGSGQSPASPDVLVVVRDSASEARFGAGAWDRAMLARLITVLTRAGAGAIGVDVPPGQPSSPGRGGAAADALLGEATALSGIVVYPVALERSGPLPGLAQHARGIGHTLARPEADGVVRKVPLFVELGDQAVPAFGLALAAVYLDVTGEPIGHERTGAVVLRSRTRSIVIPVDGRGQALVRYASADSPRSLPFHAIWTAVENGDADTLRGLVDGKVVLLLVEPVRGGSPIPGGRTMADMVIQAHLLNAVLAGGGLREAQQPWTILGSLALSGLAAWLLLALSWRGLACAGALAVGYGVTALLALPLGGLVFPIWLPLAGVALAGACSALWGQISATRRVRQLEGEMARVQRELGGARDALVRHESTVEALEEDLEAARAAVARSAGAEEELGRAADALRAQITEARTQEDQTRGRLAELERELTGLRAAESPDRDPERLAPECEAMGILTRDPAVAKLFGDLEKVARSSLPILLLGEPGTGKELFARAAHRLSPRARGPFVPVNMAAISPELFESEIFGHVRGSFTGAVGDRKGHFEQADRGTIFLDEIGDLRPEHQGKLLRVLQEKSFYRVGASRPTAADVRVVAATNRDLERGVAEGWFREDLYFRLKGVVLRLPPLRERRGDIPLLAARFVEAAAAELGRDGLTLSRDADLALAGHPWSGNVRELQHCLSQAVVLAERTVITKADLRLTAPTSSPLPAALDPGAEPGSDAAVLTCLRQNGFDMQATARSLGWDRSTVTQRLKGLAFRAVAESSGDQPKAALALAGDRSLAPVVEVKLREYTEHLYRAVHGFDSADAALDTCRRRFKNLPERHFRFLEILVRQRFEG
jgi:transcriptional regulator with GAF, ATPase, and Fis domain/CHASE2 domain-containing sensor protein